MIILDLSYQIVWLVRHVCSDKAELSFSQKKTAFRCSFKHVPNWHLVCVIYSLSHSLQGIQWIASVHCSFVKGSLGLAKICPKVKRFLNNFNIEAILYWSTHAQLYTIQLGGISLKLSPLICLTTSAFVWKPGISTLPMLL